MQCTPIGVLGKQGKFALGNGFWLNFLYLNVLGKVPVPIQAVATRAA